jgi:hypothetical protein
MQIVNDRQKIMEYDAISGRLVFLRALFSLFVCTLMPRNPIAAPPTIGPIHQVHPKRGPSKRALLVAGMTLPKKMDMLLQHLYLFVSIGSLLSQFLW